ncbi:hypothetical protein [Halorussus sp. MSC15.2]|uniref:hypothetical protein n=1 Tax=Halorussus sp. MSC15.2 TaxID=2283638 RepID=UPI0013D77144|nr:hypothetical protein [Halorussus sp. MSC15.2]NEU57103.1 hypothetical protein [Halorussus sp. MSC15.2]
MNGSQPESDGGQSTAANSDQQVPASGATRRTTPEGCHSSTATGIADAIFEVVERDYRICSNCFAVVREIDEVWNRRAADRDCVSARSLPTDRTTDAVAPVGHSSIRRPRRICECGATDHRTRLRCVSKSAAVERAANLSTAIETLRDEYRDAEDSTLRSRVERWTHDSDALQYAVGEFKSRPGLQDHDDAAIYRRALAVALRRADDESGDR